MVGTPEPETVNPVRALRYAYSEVRDNYDDPVWIRGRVTQRIVRPVHGLYYGHDGVNLPEADWDTLIVLDACRADLFESVADLDRYDAYERRNSRGSMTREWTERNFAGHQFGDTVYVSSNPYTSTIAGDAFHELREIWRDRFDDEERTVLPETVADAALAAHDEHPDKRLIVHFMQPHYPFLGHPELRYRSWDPDEIVEGPAGDEPPHDPWQALALGLADRDDIWNAYSENLGRSLAAALDVAAALDGRTVITSDHGNMLGERAWPVPLRLYGHPEGVRHPALVEIPWAVLEGDDRRRITDEGVGAIDDAATELVENRLRDLGYA